VRRREVIALLGGAAAAWPLGAGAQQPSLPVIGFLNSASPGTFASYVASFHVGLREAGFVEGQNVRIEYRWAEGRYDRLSMLATELVERKVDVIVATGGEPSALAAKAATSTIPIVFGAGSDNPVKLGLVTSLGRPGGNATGVVLLAAELEAKRFELLGEIVPDAKLMAALVNPDFTPAENQTRALREAAQATGRQVLILNASTEGEFDRVFATAARERAGALVVASDPYFNSRRDRLVALADRHRLPAIYEWREFVLAGGLMSYGTSLTGVFRQFGLYTGRILAGTRPADLPVLQPTQFEIVISARTAKALGLTIPPTLLARADEVIE
jgi:putative ABC transport system substrate-binding protein